MSNNSTDSDILKDDAEVFFEISETGDCMSYAKVIFDGLTEKGAALALERRYSKSDEVFLALDSDDNMMVLNNTKCHICDQFLLDDEGFLVSVKPSGSADNSGGTTVNFLNRSSDKKGIAPNLDKNSAYKYLICYNEECMRRMKKTISDEIRDKNENKNENKNQSCYIATVCYGDINSEEVVTFRRFRDNVLMANFVGRFTVAFYYTISPHMAKILRGYPKIIRITTFALNRIFIFLKDRNY